MSSPQAAERVYAEAAPNEIDRAVSLAESCVEFLAALPAAQIARLLDRVAGEIEGLGDELIEWASRETALPAARLMGERTRTTNQLRMFAELVREGSWKGARMDAALPDRQPARRPDLRRTLVPIGPVAVWPASNFPLAFSVAGGDTRSALAAFCPVIVKAHPGHPGTSELTAEAIRRAIAATGLPAGMFSLLQGAIFADSGVQKATACNREQDCKNGKDDSHSRSSLVGHGRHTSGLGRVPLAFLERDAGPGGGFDYPPAIPGELRPAQRCDFNQVVG